MRPSVFEPLALPDHALVDSGGAEKLERFGDVLLRRPDPQALWSRRLGAETWDRADLVFVRESDRGGRWEARSGAPAAALGSDPSWRVRVEEGVFAIRPTPFKHVGLFPEQAPNWELVARLRSRFRIPRPRLLNLFAYTGAASVLAAKAGYDVTHVDASKSALTWTRENLSLSGLPGDALRLVLDDALAFARREARRGARYHVVLLDPPHFGRGPKGERWQLEDDLAPLVGVVGELLDERALVVLSTYAVGCTAITFENLLHDLGPGDVEAGELVLREESGRRLLPCGFCARFRRGIDAPSA